LAKSHPFDQNVYRKNWLKESKFGYWNQNISIVFSIFSFNSFQEIIIKKPIAFIDRGSLDRIALDRIT
jgi:hypothetical protein